MSVVVKYEVRASDGNPTWFFVLDDPVQGVLQETPVIGSYDYVLGGSLLVDITDAVKSINISRGKNRELDVFDPGLANIVFNNEDRRFDPSYLDSPYYNTIKPNRVISVSDSIGSLYFGIVQDWNLSYDISGEATASAAAADAFSLFANQSLLGGTATPQLSGERVDAILTNSEVSWPYYAPLAESPAMDRVIFSTSQELGADVIDTGTNVLSYLQLIEQSEPGKFFIDRYGRPTFFGRNSRYQSAGLYTFADDGTGIDYNDVQVNFGSEFLYNDVIIGSVITNGFGTAEDLESKAEYGIRNITRTGLLMETTEAAAGMAVYYASKYSQPIVRYDAIAVTTPIGVVNEAANIEIGDLVTVKFTPAGVGDPTIQLSEVIGISHEIDFDSHNVVISLDAIQTTSWTLSDSIFGRLSAGNTLAY
jgi:hypothetical protein